MAPFTKKILAILLIIALILIPFGASVLAADSQNAESERTAAAMTADLCLVRPAGILATVIGGVVFVFGSPFSYFGGNIKSSYDKLLVAPAKYTFVRPLGDI